MKNLSLLIPIFIFFIAGCSSTYRVNDFSSKEKFYEDFNKSMHNKSVNVLLANNSSFISSGNVLISNDSLIFSNPNEKVMNILPVVQVKEISSISKRNNTLTGLWIGATFGFLISFPMIAMNNTDGNHAKHQAFFPASLVYTASGGLIGFVIGSILDKTYTYQFNP